jgi:hypothetical protein
MERLEERQMMAGDVAAYMQNGNLYITEAAGQAGLDNGVRVSQIAPNVVRVAGSENNGDFSISRINGQAYQDFFVTGDLVVTLGGGSDRLHLGYDGGASAPSFNNVSINMAAPEPVLHSFSKFETVFNAPDNDQVFGWGMRARGATSITTGRGGDWVYLAAADLGDGFGADHTTINTGAGSDSVSIKGARIRGNLDVQTYASLAENDVDNMWFDYRFGPNYTLVPTFIAGVTNVRMGGGADAFLVSDPFDDLKFAVGVETAGSMFVDTGAGDDSVDVTAAAIGTSYSVGHLNIYTGAGADTVKLDFSAIYNDPGTATPEVKGGVYIQTYANIAEIDVDVVNIPLSQVRGSMTVRTGAGDDLFDFHGGNVGGYLYVDMNAGKDTGFLGGHIGYDATMVMGEGDDNLTLGHVHARTLTLAGAAGVDRLRKLQPLTVDYLYESGWEYINGRPTWFHDIFLNDVKAATLAK